MSKLKTAINQKNRDLLTSRIAIGALFIICLVLCAIIYTAPSRLMIYNPPELRAGAHGGKFQNLLYMLLLINNSNNSIDG